MANTLWAKYSGRTTDTDLAMIDRTRDVLRPLDGVSESVMKTQIAPKRTRTLTTGDMKTHRFEIAIDPVPTKITLD